MKRLAFCLALAGCATAPRFPEPDASWSSYAGQLQYVTADRSVIGEFVASAKGGDFRLEFSKGGTVPLLRVARHGDHAHAEGPLARGRWSGSVASAPASLRAWVESVPAAFARAGRRGGRVEVAGAQRGERLVFISNH